MGDSGWLDVVSWWLVKIGVVEVGWWVNRIILKFLEGFFVDNRRCLRCLRLPWNAFGWKTKF